MLGTQGNPEREPRIPDNLGAAIVHLEEELREDVAEVQAAAPPPDAPVGEQIAHARRAKRLEGDNQFIEELREHKGFVEGLPDKPSE